MSLLVGTIIGTTGSWNNSGNTREYAMDGNPNTFFDAPTNYAWVGLDLGANPPRRVCKILYSLERLCLPHDRGVFQGANRRTSAMPSLFIRSPTPRRMGP